MFNEKSCKIAMIYNAIEKDLSHGCRGLNCNDCPLYEPKTGTVEYAMCAMLRSLIYDRDRVDN